ncbi:unnamed protein product [Didymodactylos carnosus]|uniref:Uncharacterized protein n=1 Tax=Didymodactylos carnosus TaxID=1234261 RepID=A0A814FKM6_9BILA|nr:unnamed protein product [Didymodactylos carnosus]CAF1158548.1 unnamed protein product [Didymodactylos carnosus]CAF3756612.1 unnamed protein product [Didymodactylos carnosus]CAF3970083.1 unnamed protein product [Didymodactylos carnosus]
MLVLEDPSYDNKLDGISCIARKNRSKCYLRLENVGFEYLIELNPLNLTWYQLCDHLATKPVTLLSNVNNINIFARTVKNELYHKYANDTWYVDTKNDYKIIGEVSCVTVNVDGTIICYVRTEQNEILIWNQADDSFQQLQTPNNTISFLTDLYCTSEYDDGITTVVCVATSTDYNVYGMLCHSNGIQCSSWILLSIKTKFQIQLRPLVFFYGNQKRHLGLYAVSTDSEPYICTCQNCTETTNNWNEIWSEWMLLTSVRPLQTLESTFINDQDKLAYIVAITQDDNMAYSTFDGQHHIPRPFLSLSNRVTSY